MCYVFFPGKETFIDIYISRLILLVDTDQYVRETRTPTVTTARLQLSVTGVLSSVDDFTHESEVKLSTQVNSSIIR